VIAPQDYLAAMARLAIAQASADDTAGRFYPEHDATDVRRLAMHERYGRWYRGSVLETHFPECRAAVRATQDATVWDALVEQYFRAHPPRFLPMHRNAAAFPAFVQARSDAAGLAPWVAEVAELEWLEWVVTSLPELPSEADPPGRLRVTPTLRRHAARHDLLAWLDDPAEGTRREGPIPAPTRITIWRDRALVAQRATLGRLDDAIVTALEAGTDPANLAGAVGDKPPRVRAVLEELHALAILRGRLDA
jgi:hypothetical protein